MFQIVDVVMRYRYIPCLLQNGLFPVGSSGELGQVRVQKLDVRDFTSLFNDLERFGALGNCHCVGL